MRSILRMARGVVLHVALSVISQRLKSFTARVLKLAFTAAGFFVDQKSKRDSLTAHCRELSTERSIDRACHVDCDRSHSRD